MPNLVAGPAYLVYLRPHHDPNKVLLTQGTVQLHLQNFETLRRIWNLRLTLILSTVNMASKEKNTALIEQAKTFKNVPWCEDYEKMISGMLFVTFKQLLCIN